MSHYVLKVYDRKTNKTIARHGYRTFGEADIMARFHTSASTRDAGPIYGYLGRQYDAYVWRETR